MDSHSQNEVLRDEALGFTGDISVIHCADYMIEEGETHLLSYNESTNLHIMLVQRQMSVIEEDLEEFQLALKHYVESASSQSGCLRSSLEKQLMKSLKHKADISTQKLSNESRYMIYEFWENSTVWNSFMVDPEQQLDVPRHFLYGSKCKT
ncbi:N-terminal EF-hand calcium-binding protein 1, partial [Saguinus oedipus]